MISVLVAAPSAVVRAGLESVVGSHPEIAVVGRASGTLDLLSRAGELQPDVVLLETDSRDEHLHAALQECATVLLIDDASAQYIREGARAVLPHGASEPEIIAAIQAVAGRTGSVASRRSRRIDGRSRARRRWAALVSRDRSPAHVIRGSG